MTCSWPFINTKSAKKPASTGFRYADFLVYVKILISIGSAGFTVELAKICVMDKATASKITLCLI